MNNDNFYALVESRYPRDLSAPCLELPDGVLYSWRDLHLGSARIAGWLASLALGDDVAAARGVAPRVVVYIDKSPEAVMLYLAVLRAGLVYLPLNTAYQRGEVEYFLRDARPAVLVCSPSREAELRPLAQAAGCPHMVTLGGERDGTLLPAAARFGDSFRTVARRAEEIAAILYTSGTTGRSKGAMLSHGNLASNATTLDEFWGFKEEREAGEQDILLHALPLFHGHGLFVALHAALLSGSRMIFLPKFEPKPTLHALRRSTVFMGVPTFYARLLAEQGLDRHACRNMRLFISGSAPLLPETFNAFRARTGHTIVERYGMSETLMLASNPYFGTPRDRLAGTVGTALPGVSVRVMRDSGGACVPGEVGQVQVQGPNVFSGYWRMPEKTIEEFTADGWFRTGDLGCLGGAGRPDTFLTLAGRSKDLIISGGYNVYPKEIESYIDEMPGVAESAVIGLPHPDFGEAVTAVVAAAGEVDTALIITRLTERFANYKVPRRVWVVDELPRNTMGKVQKSALRDRYRDAFAA